MNELPDRPPTGRVGLRCTADRRARPGPYRPNGGCAGGSAGPSACRGATFAPMRGHRLGIVAGRRSTARRRERAAGGGWCAGARRRIRLLRWARRVGGGAFARTATVGASSWIRWPIGRATACGLLALRVAGAPPRLTRRRRSAVMAAGVRQGPGCGRRFPRDRRHHGGGAAGADSRHRGGACSRRSVFRCGGASGRAGAGAFSRGDRRGLQCRDRRARARVRHSRRMYPTPREFYKPLRRGESVRRRCSARRSGGSDQAGDARPRTARPAADRRRGGRLRR